MAYAPLRPYFFWREPRTAFREIFDECERHYEREGKYWLICFAPDAVLAARNIRTIFEHWHRKHSPDRCDAPIEKFLSHDFALGTFGAACAFKQWLEPAIYDEVDRELLLIWPGQPIIWLDEEDRYDGTSPLMEAREFLSRTLRQPLEQMGLIPRRLPRGEDPTELMIEPLNRLLHDPTFVEDYCEVCPLPPEERIVRLCALIDRLQNLYWLNTKEKGVARPKKPDYQLSPLENVIVETLGEVGHRMTGAALAAACDRHYESQFKAALSVLHRFDIFDNDQRADPAGYGLVEWTQEGGQDQVRTRGK